MAKGGEVKNILKFCTIDGMYKRLEKIESVYAFEIHR